ncbi:MAG: toll/interleukin-1 receptor domain-containing protein [Verrucomicrobiales bacterium]
MNFPTKPKVQFFVSYAHEDHRKKEEFLKALRTRMTNSKHYEYELWTDAKLLPGEDWRHEIELALNQCQVGILLVSQSFLASRFIVEQELPKFVNGDRPCVPVCLLPVNFSTVDMKGLEAKQIFRWQHPRNGEFKEFSACIGDAKTHFVDQLVDQIERRLKKLPQPPTGVSTTGGKTISHRLQNNPAELEKKMRQVFGAQFEDIKNLVETNAALRKLLCETFITKAADLNSDEITYRLMFRFYENFCHSLGEMDRLYRQSGNRAMLLETLSSVIFLAMSPEFAEELRAGGADQPRTIPKGAQQGVVGLMKAWIQGDKKMPIRELAAQPHHEMWDCVPGDERNEIMQQIMKRTPGVDPDRAGAEERFRRITRAHAYRQTFIHAIVDEKQLAVLGGDLAKGGLLENVLIFAKAEGATIFRERGEGYDADFEIQLELLLESLNKHQ